MQKRAHDLLVFFRDPSSFEMMPDGAPRSQLDVVEDGSSRSNLPGSSAAERPKTCKVTLYCLLDEPDSSVLAFRVSIFVSIMIVLSVITMLIQPIVGEVASEKEEDHDIWMIMEAFFSILFTIELFLRFSVCDAVGANTHGGFFCSPSNLCDLLAVLPFYFELAFGNSDKQLRLLRIVRILRLSKMARLGRLAKNWKVAPPAGVVLVVIWGIYLKHQLEE